MKIVIAGAGVIGGSVAEALADEGEDEDIEYIDVDEADIEDLEDFEYEDEEN